MPRMYRVTMPDRTQWDIPVYIIAQNKVDYYVSIGSICRNSEAYEKEMQVIMNDNELLKDWARGNMDWEDVKPFAQKIPNELLEDDYQDGWVNGEVHIVETS